MIGFRQSIMRIGIDIRHLTDPQPAGVGGYTRQLLEALFRLDQTNEYILFATGSRRTLARLPKFDFPNVQMVAVAMPNKLLNARIALTERPYLENILKEKIDVWLFPNHNFIATKLPYAIMVHDLSYEIFPEFFTLKSRLRHRLARRIIKNANAIFCPSTSTKQDLMQIYKINEGKIHVTPLATTEAGHGGPAYTTLEIPKRFILSLATLEPRKNQISIIEAYEAYRDQTRDQIHLVIGGGAGWKSQRLTKVAKRSKYASDIHLIGYVSEEQKIELYKKAEIFVFPSFYEGFGLPVLEAMNYGVPVITSHTSSLPELTDNAALLIDPFNVNDLFVGIMELMRSKELRETLKAAGLKRAQDFSWDKTAQKTLEVFSNVTFRNVTW